MSIPVDSTPTASSNNLMTSGAIKTALDGKSPTSHTHSVKINGTEKTIAATGGTAVDLGTYAPQFKLGSTGNSIVYTTFAKFDIANEYGHGESQIILSSGGNYAGVDMGTWLITMSNRGSTAATPKASMTVRCLNQVSYDSYKPEFGYYYDTTNAKICFGVKSTAFRGNNTITILSTTGYPIEDFGDVTTAPSGWTAVTVTEYSTTTHTHGNIANGGTLTDTAAAAAGNDYVVIRDADNAKIQTSTIKGTDVADAVSKKHSHSTLTLSTTAQAYDGSHTLALPSADPYTSARTPTSHASSATTYGVGTSANYGHVKIDNTTPLLAGATHVDGVATGKAHKHNNLESVARADVTTVDLDHVYTNNHAHMFLAQITNATSSTHDPGDGYMLSFMWDNSSAYDAQLYIPASSSNADGRGRLKIRYKNSSTWGDWGYLPAASQATTLTSSDNLNSLKGNALGESLSFCWTTGNAPTGATEITGEGTAPTAVMQVIRTHSTFCIQIAYTASKGMFWRRANGDTWSSWTKILTGADIPGSITSSDIDDIWASV